MVTFMNSIDIILLFSYNSMIEKTRFSHKLVYISSDILYTGLELEGLIWHGCWCKNTFNRLQCELH